MSDIVLNGVNINELKKQKQAIQKDASLFISSGVKQVRELIEYIVENPQAEDVDAKAEAATEVLENIKVVSGVSGVEYMLPYSNEYGDYYDEKPFYDQLEEVEELDSGSYKNKTPVYDLMNLLEDMQYNVKQWNTSNC